MSPMQKTSILLVVAGATLAVYFSFSNIQTDQAPTESSSDVAEQLTQGADENPPRHPLLDLAQHHCGQLEPVSESKACIKQIETDIATGNLEPKVPEINPLACNGIADAKKQHDCHGWMGHDFAVSTGDPVKCDIIPQPTIKASCKRLITVNEIKKLYALDAAVTTGNKTP